MAKDTKKFVSYPFTTPRGTFVYPKLTEPDYGTKDYPNPDGSYNVRLRMSKADAEAFANRPNKKAGGKTLREVYDEAIATAQEDFKELPVATRKKLKEVTVNDLYNIVYDPDTEEETGDVEFRFKMKASGEVKKGPRAGQTWSRKPDLFDAKGQKIGKGVDIWGGTIGRVSFDASPYFIPATGAAGLSTRLAAVQVIELVSAGGRSADDHGFEEEDGYEAEEEQKDDRFEDEDEDGGDEGTSEGPSEDELGF